ncbi:MAG: PAS domain-containing protein [Neorhizobium sp.]|nr:PAS domain-containing protein [Neorhizobium sp.]
MEALIDLFWSKYDELQQAIEREDETMTAALDRELDPLMLAILGTAAGDAASIQLQFRFALDLLNEEADDRSCVRRNAHLLQTLVERYLGPAVAKAVPDAAVDADEAEDTSLIDAAIANGLLDDALLNRLSDRILVVAPGYRILYSNDTNARRLDIAREELIGRHLGEFVGLHRFRNEYAPNLDRCFAGENTSVTYADEVDGETVVMRCRMSPFTRSSTLIGALVVIRETADRRRRRSAA